jgi:hypothetical protein
MYSKWMRLLQMLAVVLCIGPPVAAVQPQPHEFRLERDADQAGGAIQIVNDWQHEVRLSLWSGHRERIGEWSIRPEANVVLQERGERINVRPNDKVKLGEDSSWVEVGQVGQFQNGMWSINVGQVWQAAQPARHKDNFLFLLLWEVVQNCKGGRC